MKYSNLVAIWKRAGVARRSLSTLLQVASGAVTLLAFAGVTSTVISAKAHRNPAIILSVLVVVTAFLFLAGVATVVRRSTCAKSDLLLESASYTFQVEPNRIDMAQEIALRVRALRDGIDHIRLKYSWTGTGPESVIPETPGHYIRGVEVREMFYYYDLCFGRRLRANEPEEVRIRYALRDENNTFDSVLAKTVTEPMNKLLLNVRLPVDYGCRVITRRHYSSYFDVDEVGSERMPFHGGTHTWEIDQPLYGHKYVLRWE